MCELLSLHNTVYEYVCCFWNAREQIFTRSNRRRISPNGNRTRDQAFVKTSEPFVARKGSNAYKIIIIPFFLVFHFCFNAHPTRVRRFVCGCVTRDIFTLCHARRVLLIIFGFPWRARWRFTGFFLGAWRSPRPRTLHDGLINIKRAV